MKKLFFSALLMGFLITCKTPEKFILHHTKAKIVYVEYYNLMGAGITKYSFPQMKLHGKIWTFKVPQVMIIRNDSAYMFWKPYFRDSALWIGAKLTNNSIFKFNKCISEIDFNDTRLYKDPSNDKYHEGDIYDGPGYSYTIGVDKKVYSFIYGPDPLPQIPKLRDYLLMMADSADWKKTKPQMNLTDLANALLKGKPLNKSYDTSVIDANHFFSPFIRKDTK